VRERRSEIGPINVGLSRALGKKESVTPWTKDVDCEIARQIGQTDGKHGLALTEYVWTAAKMCHSILFIHGMHASIRNDITVPQAKSLTTKHTRYQKSHVNMQTFDDGNRKRRTVRG
jgi:hypothetical protein